MSKTDCLTVWLVENIIISHHDLNINSQVKNAEKVLSRKIFVKPRAYEGLMNKKKCSILRFYLAV